MAPRVSVLLAPRDAGPPPRAAAVSVDVLRATTVLTVARLHGARQVFPAATREEALALARGTPGALLCGERDGRRIEGFDLGNSPFEYGFDVVSGRALVFASTNGSLALLRARRARRRVLAAFVNAGAVVEALRGEEEVAIVCAGKLGRFSLEDAALAGWLVERLVARGARGQGTAAEAARRIAPRDAGEVRALVQGSEHGRYLRSLGPAYAADVEFCAALDTIGQAFEA